MIWGNSAPRPVEATAAEEPSSSPKKTNQASEANVEELLSAKLLQGFLLVERPCPRCETPLVKQEQALRSTQDKLDIHSPVPGVPFCVKCCAHVMTDESDLLRIQRCFQGQSMQGKILIDFENGKPLMDEATVATEDTSLASDHYGLENHNNDETPNEARDDDEKEASDRKADVRIMGDGEIEIVPGEEVEPQMLSDNEYVIASVVETIQTKRQSSAKNGTPQSRTSYIERIKLKHSQSQTPRKDDDDAATKLSIDPPESNKSGTSVTLGNSSSIKTPKDEFWPSFDERKQIATKVLSVKMLQGHRLLQTQCRKCSMPMTECQGETDCVVCPVLHKRSLKLKEKKAQQDRARNAQDDRMLMNSTLVQKNKNQFFEQAKQQSTVPISNSVFINETAAHDSTAEEREQPQNHASADSEILSNEANVEDVAPIVQSTDVIVTEARKIPAEMTASSGVVSPIVHKAFFKSDHIIGNHTNEPLVVRAAIGATTSPHNADQLKLVDGACDHTAPTMDPTLQTENTGPTLAGQAPQIVEVESSVGSNSVVRQIVEPNEDFPQPRGPTSIITGCTGPFGSRNKIASPTKKSLLDRAGNKPKLQKKAGASGVSSRAYLMKPVTKTANSSVEGSHNKPSFGVNGNSERAVMGIMKVSPQLSHDERSRSANDQTQERNIVESDEGKDPKEMSLSKDEGDDSKPPSAEKTEKIGHPAEGKPNEMNDIDNQGEQEHENEPEGDNSSKVSTLHSDSTISSKTTKVVYSEEGCEAIDVPTERAEEPNNETGEQTAKDDLPCEKSTVTVKRSLKARSADSSNKRNLAKQEMAKKMALGWILLNAACPKCTMPLMADPKGEKEVCVTCHSSSNIEEKLVVAKRERSDPGGDESTLEEAEVSVRRNEKDCEETLDIVASSSSSSLSVAKQSIEIPTNDDDDGKSRARAMWSTMTKTRTSRKLVPPRHDPPAVQGHTVRRKEAQDCEQSVVQKTHSPPKASSWLAAGALATSFLTGRATENQGAKADPVEVKQKQKAYTPKADPDASMTNVLRNKVFGGEKKVGSSPLEISYNSRNPTGIKLDPAGPKEEEVEEASLHSNDETTVDSSVGVPEGGTSKDTDTEDEEDGSNLVKSRGPSPEDIGSMFSSRVGGKSEISSQVSETTGDIQIVRMPNSNTSTVALKHTPTGTDESEILSLAIPPGFDINNQAALRKLLAAAKGGMPLSVKTSLDEIEEDTCTGRVASPGMSEARLPMNSPISPENPQRRQSRNFGSRSDRMAAINNKKMAKKSGDSSALTSDSKESRSQPSVPQNKSLGVSTTTGDSYTTPIMVSSPQSREIKSKQYQIVTSSTGSQSETIIVLDDVLDDEQAYKLSSKQEADFEAEVSDNASVTSEAIDALLLRIEETQTQLALAGDEEDSLEKREKLAKLLEQLSAAAAAVEEMDPDSTSVADTTSIVS